MIISLVILLFDITSLPAEYRTAEFRKGWRVNYISVGYNTYRDTWVKNYFQEAPIFADEAYVLFLNHEDYLQFLMISHLPWLDIVNCFNHQIHRAAP